MLLFFTVQKYSFYNFKINMGIIIFFYRLIVFCFYYHTNLSKKQKLKHDICYVNLIFVLTNQPEALPNCMQRSGIKPKPCHYPICSVKSQRL